METQNSTVDNHELKKRSTRGTGRAPVGRPGVPSNPHQVLRRQLSLLSAAGTRPAHVQCVPAAPRSDSRVRKPRGPRAGKLRPKEPACGVFPSAVAGRYLLQHASRPDPGTHPAPWSAALSLGPPGPTSAGSQSLPAQALPPPVCSSSPVPFRPLWPNCPLFSLAGKFQNF